MIYFKTFDRAVGQSHVLNTLLATHVKVRVVSLVVVLYNGLRQILEFVITPICSKIIGLLGTSPLSPFSYKGMLWTPLAGKDDMKCVSIVSKPSDDVDSDRQFP